MELKADHHLDCRGLVCPMPIIRIARAVQGIQVGDVLEMLATDPGSKPDMEAWTKHTGHELLAWHETGGVYTFYVRRASQPGPGACQGGRGRGGVP